MNLLGRQRLGNYILCLSIVLLLAYAATTIVAQVPRPTIIRHFGGFVVIVPLSSSAELDINVWTNWPPGIVVWRQEPGVNERLVTVP